ncbi:MAG: lipopolysaccharide biosynthesis protein [Deltaproteobacteria bacterium]|nr:lipopolysaccharide biosynthesis protein [Deltaproteobacteria bacterium]
MAQVEFKTLARSTLVAWLAEAWRIGSRFILTPIVLAKIGKDGYGVWTLVFSLSNYVSMVNASFGVAYIKATAECMRSGDQARLERILGSGMLVIGGVAVFGLGATWVLGASILDAINVPARFIGQGRVALMLIMGCLVLRMSVGCALEVLAGLQRIDLTYKLYIVASFVEFFVTLPLLFLGFDIVGMGVGYAVGQVVCIAVAWISLRRMAPQLRLSPLAWTKDGVREVFSLGGRFQVLGIVTTSVMEGVKILLSVLLGVGWVAIYDLCDKLLTLGKSLSSSVLAPLLAAFADLQAGGEGERERGLFVQASKALAVVSSGTFAFLAVLGGPVLLAWTNQDVAEAALALQLLAVGEVLMLQTGVISANLRAQGKVMLELATAMIATAIVLVSVVPLARAFDFDGIVVSRLAGQAIAALWYMRAFFRFANLSERSYVEGARIGPVVAVVAIAAALVFAGHLLLAPLLVGVMPPRWAAALEVAVLAVPYAVVLVGGSWRFVVAADERDQLRAIVMRKLGKLRRGAAPPP